MSQVVISDSSVLMDLAKANLFEVTLLLPYEFVIPDVIVAEELLDLGQYDGNRLIEMGFKEGSLDGNGVTKAFAYTSQYRAKLSRQDCFALTLAEEKQAILMTGDRRLRQVAEEKDVEVHGLIWLIELMLDHEVVEPSALTAPLKLLEADPLVRVPKHLIRGLLKRTQEPAALAPI